MVQYYVIVQSSTLLHKTYTPPFHTGYESHERPRIEHSWAFLVESYFIFEIVHEVVHF